MKGAFVIADKDLRGLFVSPLFYILTGICAVVWSFQFYFLINQFVSQSMMQMMQGPQGEGLNLHFTVMARHISTVNLMMIFSVAALTMRLFTEEKRQRTFDLLLTSPVTATHIAIGKLIAGTLTAWALIAVSLLYPLSMAFFGKLDWGPLFSSYIGLFLMAAMYVSVGMFASSLTESTVLSVLMGLIFNVMIWFIGVTGEVAESATQRAIADHINISNHFMAFLKGQPSLAALAFFLSVIGLFTFLTQRVVESARWR
ncbi:MAG: ABC transporter permease subunit, partial [Bdellovibrionota bacterium]